MGGFGALLVGIGIIVIIYGLIQRAKVGRVSAPLFQTGQLAQGGAAAAGPGGTASAQGNVLCQQPLLSPVTGKPCLWYSLKITSERKEGDKTVTNTLRDDKVAAQFAIDDGSGPLYIDAKEGGDFDPCDTFRDSKKTGLLGGIVGQDLQFGNFQLATGALALGTEYKVEEKVLPIVPTLYVNGKMSQQGANVLSKPGFPRSMIISNKSRDEVLGAAQAGAKYALLGGLGSAVVGAILGVVSSFMGGDEVKADTAAATSAAAPAATDAALPAPADTGATAAAALPNKPATGTQRTANASTGKPASGTTTSGGSGTSTGAGSKPASGGDAKAPPAGGDAKAPPAGGDAKAPPAGGDAPKGDTKAPPPAGGGTSKPAGGKAPLGKNTKKP